MTQEVNDLRFYLLQPARLLIMCLNANENWAVLKSSVVGSGGKEAFWCVLTHTHFTDSSQL